MEKGAEEAGLGGRGFEDRRPPRRTKREKKTRRRARHLAGFFCFLLPMAPPARPVFASCDPKRAQCCSSGLSLQPRRRERRNYEHRRRGARPRKKSHMTPFSRVQPPPPRLAMVFLASSKKKKPPLSLDSPEKHSQRHYRQSLLRGRVGARVGDEGRLLRVRDPAAAKGNGHALPVAEHGRANRLDRIWV